MNDRLLKIAKLKQKLNEGDLGTISAFLELDDKQTELKSEIKSVDLKVDSLGDSVNKEHEKVYDELIRLEEEKLSLKQVEGLKTILKGDKGEKGDKGDKGETTVVEKIIEKTEVIKEMQPIFNETIKEIKIENPLTPDESIDLINKSEKQIDYERVSKLPEKFKKIEDRLDNFSLPPMMTPVGSSGLEKVKSSGTDIKQGVTEIDFGTNLTVTRQGNGVRVDATEQDLSDYTELILDTESDILELTPLGKAVALATDTFKYFFFDGTNWNESSAYYAQTNDNPNIGAEQDHNVNDVGTDFINNKKLSNVRVGGYNRDLDSGYQSVGALDVRYDSTTGDHEMSLWSTLTQSWRKILSGIFIRNDEEENTLISTDYPRYNINVYTGNSIELDFEGSPMVQWGEISMGAIQPPVTLDGGQF